MGRHHRRHPLSPRLSTAPGSGGLHQKPECLPRICQKEFLLSRGMPTRSLVYPAGALCRSSFSSVRWGPRSPASGERGPRQGGARTARGHGGVETRTPGRPLTGEDRGPLAGGDHGGPASEGRRSPPEPDYGGLPQEDVRAQRVTIAGIPRLPTMMKTRVEDMALARRADGTAC